jgi:hypothetical protein
MEDYAKDEEVVVTNIDIRNHYDRINLRDMVE